VITTNFYALAIIRFFVGLCLAGVYLVGMNIAVMEYSSGLGARLGVLVGALTVGTAFPWLLRGVSDEKCLPLEVTLELSQFWQRSGLFDGPCHDSLRGRAKCDDFTSPEFLLATVNLTDKTKS
jgi:hypothetical protein